MLLKVAENPGPRRLRVGLMLRAVDDVDGQGIYIRKLCEALFDADQHDEFIAFYSHPEQAGRYADRPNVREIVVPAPGKLLWDQVLVPWAARREGVDVLFHHKFSIPLVTSCPAVVQQRGTEYWSHPEFYSGFSDVWTAVQSPHDPPLLPPCGAGTHQFRYLGR